MKENRFYKTERLCHKRDFELLFEEQQSIFVYPFKVVFRTVDFIEKEELKLGISVSKRNFKRAVKRNYIKRRIREGFRLNKQALKTFLNENHIGLHLLLVYVSKDTLEFSDVEPKIKLILEKVTKILHKDSSVDSVNTD